MGYFTYYSVIQIDPLYDTLQQQLGMSISDDDEW